MSGARCPGVTTHPTRIGSGSAIAAVDPRTAASISASDAQPSLISVSIPRRCSAASYQRPPAGKSARRRAVRKRAPAAVVNCVKRGDDAICQGFGWEAAMALLQEKVVLVTGAGAGIGRATALGMAAEGAAIAAVDIDKAAAERAAAEAAGNHRRVIAIEADCGDVASIDRMVAQAVAELGRLDVIVNNAGITRYAYIMDLTEADWDRIHRVNAKGLFFCLQRAAREMIRQFETDGSGGRIVNIASI